MGTQNDSALEYGHRPAMVPQVGRARASGMPLALHRANHRASQPAFRGKAGSGFGGIYKGRSGIRRGGR